MLSTVMRKFNQDCEAFEVPESQQLSVLYVMFRGEALRYDADHIYGVASTVKETFSLLQAHFMTPAHRDTYTTEWNTPSFENIKLKHPNKSISQQLDVLFQRARDLQTMIDNAYNSPLLLRDCIINAVKSQSFYIPLITSAIPTVPNILHTRLHQCIRQKYTAPSLSTKNPAYKCVPIGQKRRVQTYSN